MTDVALWLTVMALGAWHGLNPAMGWPLAVANGLTEKRGSAVLATIVPLGTGHFLAMAIVLLPFAALGWLMAWSGPVRLAAGAAVLLFGVYRLTQPRHPRMLARIPPTRLALWSFLMSSAHGAGLMLLPFALGLCASAGAAQRASRDAVAIRRFISDDLISVSKRGCPRGQRVLPTFGPEKGSGRERGGSPGSGCAYGFGMALSWRVSPMPSERSDGVLAGSTGSCPVRAAMVSVEAAAWPRRP